MATPWYSLPSLLVDIASALNQDDATQLAPRWSGVGQNALDDAQAELVSFLDTLGFLQADIDSWDTLPKQAAHRRLALYFALVTGNPLGTYPTGFLELLDPRKMLREAGTLNIDGIATAPVAGASAVGGIAHGSTGATSRRFIREFRSISGERCGW